MPVRWLRAAKCTATVGYNVQIAVDAEHHLIVAHEVTNQGYDRHQLAPMAFKAQRATGCEQITALADRGYFNGDQVLSCEGTGVAPVVPKNLTSHCNVFSRKRLATGLICPDGPTAPFTMGGALSNG